ncbi:MAG TPA: acetyl-CoA carboxylase carboxyltransferase subunit beta [Candidatus Aerophobetes bacterium]|uniref:Acetyl-coenzyme A carboxylase carboxyl transferase subunit beta n=1 Tax=Aerophobetes bacterium TaxID=2030807 RepID=A0A662DAA2_UNCAE|nr:MAG: acetyl-CoA carboxylase carboxyl transferase subunit beta [Candidatus Aerophobetes bacterium]HDN85168.1 acetyl-CoA carboxylase carboxyltransferase subunit beta [Candidatus Aerophobetes bacterium]
MGWFERTYNRIKKGKKKIDVPDGLWTKCVNCSEIIYNKTLDDNLRVCPKCGYHFYIGARRRIEITLDKDSFVEYNSKIYSHNPLDFPGYEEKLKKGEQTTGLDEAVVIGEGKLGGKSVAIGVTDFGFMGGSMGSVVGERLTIIIERAIEKKLPLIIISGSGGGARMQEGVLSLMQMVKTSSAIAELKSKGGLYISVLTNPTMGGAMASFASRGDIVIAEPGALLGFAGPRVIMQTIKQQMPKNFQKAESLLEHGMVDLVVERPNIRPTLIKILNFLL